MTYRGSPTVTEINGVTVVGPPSGSDDSAALQLALDQAGNGIVQLQSGTYRIDGVTWSALGSGLGKTPTLQGTGMNSTILGVIGAAAFGIRTQSSGDGTAEAFIVRELQFRLTSDRAYDRPLFKAIQSGGFHFDNVKFMSANVGSTSVTSYTGTFVKIANSINGKFERVHWRAGRYAVPLEYDDDEGTLIQIDTVGLDNCLCNASLPMLFQPSASGFHNVVGVNTKFLNTQDLDPTWPNFSESTLNGGTSIGATSITLPGGAGVNFSIGDPILIGLAARDGNKVTNVAGDVLTLAQPLRFAHANGDPVFAHAAAAIHCGGNMQNFRFIASHFEKYAIAVLLGGTCIGFEIDGGYSTSGELVRVEGQCQYLSVGRTFMSGSVGQVNKNSGINRPAYQAGSLSQVRVGPFPSLAPSVALTVLEGSWVDVYYEMWDFVSGVPRRTVNAANAGAAFIHERVMVNGVEKYSRDYNGVEFFLSGPTIRAGANTPEGAVTAPIGSIYLRTNGGALTSFYVKETGAGNVGWVGK